jgi:hypothetical protein
MDANIPHHYVLIGQTPVPEYDLLTWARWIETAERRVLLTRIFDMAVVSTVFLGLDHSYDGGPPLIFETMVFWADEGGNECRRCSTWIEAEAMHREMVREASSPHAYWEFLRRTARRTLEAALMDWCERCKKLGLPGARVATIIEELALKHL